MEGRVNRVRIKCEIDGYEGTYFELGQKWETRDGDIVEISQLDTEDEVFPIAYLNKEDCWVTTEGCFDDVYKDDFRDLVKLIQEVPQPRPIVETNKLSVFLKENKAYNSFVEQSLVIEADLKDIVEQINQDLKQETQPEPQTEYFVFVEGNKAPKVAHSTLFLAEKEAIRLSEKEIGREVSIMTKVKSYKSEVFVKEI